MDLSYLKNKKVLLAYSAGTDSNALFHMLSSQQIFFDLIMVNYNTRKESKEEVLFAKKLSKKHNSKLHLLNVENFNLNQGNFEKRARDIRYDFFDKTMNSYDVLVLGHNLSDKLEWFFMQLIKGAGIKELYGMERISTRKNYMIFRPLLDLSKQEIMDYILANNIQYFYDSSNDNEKFTRNYFRHNFSDKILSKYANGIRKTFSILKKEISLLPQATLEFQDKDFFVFNIKFEIASSFISSILKKKGYLLSGKQREEFDEQEEITVIIDNVSYTFSFRDNKLFFSPYISNITIPKKEKEIFRIKKIPPKHRAYLYQNNIEF